MANTKQQNTNIIIGRRFSENQQEKAIARYKKETLFDLFWMLFGVPTV